MSDVVPRLDSVEFDELVELARSAIPRYAPDWTDHNLHDPGMTLIDLFAWIVDQQVYRAGSVGGRHRAAFAALLGRRGTGPVPSRGTVWPDAPPRDGRFIATGSAVVCREHTELAFVLSWADDADGSSLYLPPVELRGIVPAHRGVALPAPSVDGTGSWTLGAAGRTEGVTATLRFDGPLHTTVPARVLLGIDVVPPPGPAPVDGDPPWGPVRYAYRTGAGRWTPVDVAHDGTAGLSRTGVVVLEIPAFDVKAAGSELRLALGDGFFPVPPQIRTVRINVLPVVQVRREPPADLAAGTGLPDQLVALDTTDLVGSGPPLEILVDDDVWQRRDDLDRSGPQDPHYVLRSDGVLFGNGVNGHRPRVGARIRHSGLSRTLGASGDLRRDLAWSVPALGPEIVGRNRDALSGGRDRTTADDLAAAARRSAVDRTALLTDEDLAGAARRLSGLAVGRAEVLDHFDRRTGDRRPDGVRTVVVVPHQPPSGESPGLLPVSQAYLDAVAARLAARRVLGERLVVQGPAVVAVDLSVTVVPEAGSVAADVENDVRRALHHRLAAVPDAGDEPWPLGRDLSVLDVEVVVAGVPSVSRVAAVSISVTGRPPGTDPVAVPRDGLVALRHLDVVARTAVSGRGRSR